MNVDNITPGFTPVPTQTPIVTPKTDVEIKTDARATGLKDSFLTALFTSASFGVFTLGQWFMDNHTQINLGKYEWVKVPLTILVAALIKGFDRKKHEDKTTPSTGLIQL